MKADELWNTYSETINSSLFAKSVIYKHDFLAALKKYGEHVKAEAVRVCIDKAEWNKGLGYHGHMERVANDCAAAIEKMELP